MKKLLLVLGGIVVLAIAALAVFAATYKPAQRPAPAERIEATPARLARGRYLVNHVVDCFGCHSNHDYTRYAGPLNGPEGAGADVCLTEEHGVPGEICFPNITPDRETGIGGWTDGEVLRAVREGVGRDGNALFPMMPYMDYRALSDEDARAIVAYLRTVPAVRHEVRRTDIQFPVSFFIKTAPKPLEGPVPEPDRADSVRYGEYLATVGGCKFCHTPLDDKNQPIPSRAFAGGQEIRGPWGTVRSSNLTPHETGLGLRTKAEFIGVFRSFQNVEAVAVPVPENRNTAMPWFAYAGMTDEDLGALYDYLRTLKPVESRIDKFPMAMAR